MAKNGSIPSRNKEETLGLKDVSSDISNRYTSLKTVKQLCGYLHHSASHRPFRRLRKDFPRNHLGFYAVKTIQKTSLNI